MESSAFVRGVAERLRSDERHAEAIIRLVFQEVRDGLGDAGASDVAMRLPPAVRPLWTDHERFPCASEQPYQLELLGTVMQWGALPDSTQAERAIVAVFAALQDLLDGTGSAGAVQRIARRLPQDLEILWGAAERGRVTRAPQRRADPLRAARPPGAHSRRACGGAGL